MPRKPSNLETVQLALELLRRIPRTHAITAAELWQQLKDSGINRDIRTIQRQLDELSQHFDIDRDARSKPFGYRWKSHAAVLSVPGLSPQESLVLRLAEQHLGPLFPSDVMKSMAGLFRQADTNLKPHTRAKQEREWLSKVRVMSSSPPMQPPVVKPGVFEAVSHALYANEWLEIDYRNATGKASKSRVMPLALVQQDVRLYIVCGYEGYDDQRVIVLHRISKATPIALKFQRPKDFDLDAYLQLGHIAVSKGDPIKLRLTVDERLGRVLSETPLSKDQSMRQSRKGLVFTATVTPTTQLARWIKGQSSGVISITPRAWMKED